MLLVLPLLVSLASANMFDFFGNGFHQQQHGGQQYNPEEHEVRIMRNPCAKYVCQDTQACVELPQDCPCPFPSSQLRCGLPNGSFLCISKPSGDRSAMYDDSDTNMNVDAGDDNVRDCGWVKRAYNGLV